MVMMIFAGSEISQDLVEVLQKKLDEVVLETFWLNLSRNPNTKLSIEDVQVGPN